MKFCPECSSMLYYIEENAALYGKCKNCGYSAECHDRIIESVIYKINNIHSTESKNYLRYDPTLPRTIHKKCPNNDCPSRKNKVLQQAVFYPDQTTMKLIYICTVCNTEWRYT